MESYGFLLCRCRMEDSKIAEFEVVSSLAMIFVFFCSDACVVWRLQWLLSLMDLSFLQIQNSYKPAAQIPRYLNVAGNMRETGHWGWMGGSRVAG